MKKLMLLSCVALSACGSFPLGTSYPQNGQSRDETRQQILVCKDQSEVETNTDARVAGTFLAGLTIVGAPVAIAAGRAKQREIFAQCMTTHGYKVVAPK